MLERIYSFSVVVVIIAGKLLFGSCTVHCWASVSASGCRLWGDAEAGGREPEGGGVSAAGLGQRA